MKTNKEFIDSLTPEELRVMVLEGMTGKEMALDRLLELEGNKRELAVRAEYDKNFAFPNWG